MTISALRHSADITASGISPLLHDNNIKLSPSAPNILELF
ncbi:hypothetical protein GNIT_3532 [Glaciecola nitratireducens FR1064]|uniref:Uncharacterized protein n=1 Tax=Glaciecola nitratireducens (strain JCM 12485 / KCTC 12276 / FR1064) TaxID=1085623 RepID=G4QNR7_GLANF|nr:hypothetical protein GNIT_3532 [Glaciecola nitratireducens FR1064]